VKKSGALWKLRIFYALFDTLNIDVLKKENRRIKRREFLTQKTDRL